MSSRGITSKTMMFESKNFTFGDFKRVVNKIGIIKITKITDIQFDCFLRCTVFVETKDAEKIQIKVDFNAAGKYHIARVYIPKNNTIICFSIEYEHEDKYTAMLLSADFYEDKKRIGYIAIENNMILACKKFSDNTGIVTYASSYSQFAMSVRRSIGCSSINYVRDSKKIKALLELIDYLDNLSTPINVQKIFERFKYSIDPKSFPYVKVTHFQSKSPIVPVRCHCDIKRESDAEDAGMPEFSNWINYTEIYDEVFKAYTTVDGNESFSVIRDCDDWYYSDGNVIIRKLHINNNEPIVSNITISFKDEETALKQMGNIDLKRILGRIAELQKKLQK